MSPMQTYIIFPLLASKMQLKNVKKIYRLLTLNFDIFAQEKT